VVRTAPARTRSGISRAAKMAIRMSSGSSGEGAAGKLRGRDLAA
jgi:hypothetical protein